MQNRIRCRVYIDQSMHDVTADLQNWDEIYSKLKRVDYGGVMRSFAGKFEFVRNARDVIRSDFVKNGIRSAPKLVWEERDDEWAWKEVFSYVLDVSSYSDDGGFLSISAIDDSVEGILKANKGTQYEYSVDAIKDKNSLLYDGIELFNNVKWIVAGESNDESSDVSVPIPGNDYRTVPIYIQSSEIKYNDSLECSDINQEMASPSIGFIKAIKNSSLSLSIDFYFKSNSIGETRVMIMKNGVGNIPGAKWTQYRGSVDFVHCKVDLNLNLKAKDALTLAVISLVNYGELGDCSVIFKDVKISCTWPGRMDNPITIDIISPSKLLNRLLQSMNGGNEGLFGEIDLNYSDRIKHCMLLSAESIRGIPSAKLYTSFSKFSQWMSVVFGYVYEVDGNTVRFKHRTAFFDKEVTFDLGGDVCEFNCSVVSSLIYSRVRVGYDKQDYDSINGRDEFRFTTEYSTGSTLTDNKLELVSSYRADSYGIEFLTQKRGEDTTDKDSDNDVFFVGAKLDSDVQLYKLIRTGFVIQGVLSPKTMFNTMYSPRSLLLANKGFIGVSISRLEYASSEGNSEVIIDGISEKDPFVVDRNEALFMPFEVNFETSIQDFPSNKKGLVRIENDGYVYSGFIEEAETFHGKSKSNGYKLLATEIVEEK